MKIKRRIVKAVIKAYGTRQGEDDKCKDSTFSGSHFAAELLKATLALSSEIKIAIASFSFAFENEYATEEMRMFLERNDSCLLLTTHN